MAQHSRRNMIFQITLLLVCFLGITLQVHGGGDPSCPSDTFPLRLAPGNQGIALRSTTLYSEPTYSSDALREIPIGTRFNVSVGGTAECFDGDRLVYVEMADGATGWAYEVFLEAYQLAPFNAPTSLAAAPSQIESAILPAGQVDYNGVHLFVDPDLAIQLEAQFVPVSDLRNYIPAHIELKLTPANDLDNYMAIRVMSAQDVDNYYPGTIAALGDVLDGVPGAEVPLDKVWMFSVARRFGPPYESIIPLGNGRAHWSLGYDWQDDLYPNNSIENSVLGITEDGLYYIQATFITHYKDSSIYIPPTDSRDDPNIASIIDTFHQSIFDTIAAASDSDFTPPPSQIHALLSSLTVDAGALQEVITEANVVAAGFAAEPIVVEPLIIPTPRPEDLAADVSSLPAATPPAETDAVMIEAVPLRIGNPGDRTNYKAVFAPDGQTFLMSSSVDHLFYLWTVKRAQIIRTFSGHREGWGVMTTAFSPDGRLILSAGGDGVVMLWDAQTGALLHTLIGHKRSVTEVAFSPDGTSLLAGDDDNGVILWDIPSGAIRYRLTGHERSIMNVDFSPDGQKILALSFHDRLIVWNAQTGEEIGRLDYDSFPVEGAGFMLDNTTVLVVAANGQTSEWNLERDSRPPYMGELYEGARVMGIQVSPDGHSAFYVADTGQPADFSSINTQVNRVDFGTGEIIALPHTTASGGWSVNNISFDHQTFYKAKYDSRWFNIELWDINTNSLIQTFQGSQITGSLTYIYGYDRQTFITLDSDYQPYLWSATGFDAPIVTPTLIPSPTTAPTSLPQYCPASPPSRIQVGDTARVTLSAAGQIREDLRVRSSAAGDRIGAMSEGTKFRVLGGYQCANDITWWQIETLDRAITGWVAEGAAPDDYYIEPIGN